MPSDEPTDAGRAPPAPDAADRRRASRGARRARSRLRRSSSAAAGDAYRDHGAEGLDTPASPATRPLVLVALSGGADSLALAAATAFEAPRAGWRAGAVIVDHGLQAASADVAARAARQARELGLDPVVVRQRRGVWRGRARGIRSRRALRRARRRRRRDGRGARPARPHPRRPGRDRAARTRSRFGHDQPRRHARPTRAATRARCSRSGARPPAGLRRRGPRTLGRPAQRRPRVRARARARARAARCSRPSSAPASPRRSPARPTSCAKTTRPSTSRSTSSSRRSASPPRPASRSRCGVLAANPAALRQRIIRHVLASEFGVSLSRAQTLEVARLVTDWHGQDPLDLPEACAPRARAATCSSRHRIDRGAASRPLTASRPLSCVAAIGSWHPIADTQGACMDSREIEADLTEVLVTEAEIQREARRTRPADRGRLRGRGRAARRRAEGRRHGDGRPRPRAAVRTSPWTGWPSRRTAPARSRAVSCAS